MQYKLLFIQMTPSVSFIFNVHLLLLFHLFISGEVCRQFSQWNGHLSQADLERKQVIGFIGHRTYDIRRQLAGTLPFADGFSTTPRGNTISNRNCNSTSNHNINETITLTLP
jgi:hypothetical protein